MNKRHLFKNRSGKFERFETRLAWRTSRSLYRDEYVNSKAEDNENEGTVQSRTHRVVEE